jgi:predicted ATPase
MFVGRSAELASLAGCLHKATAGTPATAALLGEAGVGKTRCLHAFADQARAAAATVLQGACPPLEDGTLPYAPIVDALRRARREAPGWLADPPRRSFGWCRRWSVRATHTGPVTTDRPGHRPPASSASPC